MVDKLLRFVDLLFVVSPHILALSNVPSREMRIYCYSGSPEVCFNPRKPTYAASLLHVCDVQVAVHGCRTNEYLSTAVRTSMERGLSHV